MVDRKDGRKIHRYIIPNNDIVAHKQWIIDNCTAPNEPTPCFIDLELSIVIDSRRDGMPVKILSGILKSPIAVQLLVIRLDHYLQISKKPIEYSIKSGIRKIVKFKFFDVTGRDIPSIDAAQVILSKFEFNN